MYSNENFGTDHYVDRNYHGAIDEYGLKYNHPRYTYRLGLQSLTLGAVLFMTMVILASILCLMRSRWMVSLENDKFYAVQGSYAMKDKASVGAMIVHPNYGKDTTNVYMGGKSSVNYYSVYGSYPLSDKLTILAEYFGTTLAIAF